ncbi:ATP-binding protein [Poseidonocella sp. HB161398]|uniref:ATP-binding protein n=1 Tax=Poseidonocella sp. HB161398 TaxID=2320855 RepID=UPI00110883D4|nr:ATP-binding protein [Poseidonocella sp. HB161398]
MTEALPIPAAPRLCDAVAEGLAALLPAAGRPGAARPGTLLHAAVARPAREDRALMALARSADLGLEDLLAVALAEAVERDPAIGQALRSLQGEGFGPWPSIGALARLAAACGLEREGTGAFAARAFALGLVVPGHDGCVPQAERTFRLSEAMALAMDLAPERPAILAATGLPDGWRAAAAEILAHLGTGPLCLSLRQGERADRRLFAAALAEAAGRRAVQLPGAPGPGTGAAAGLAGWLPVQELATEAGRRARLAPLPGYHGPRIVLAGREGGIEAEGLDVIDLDLPGVAPQTRAALWRAALPGTALPAALPHLRFGPDRIRAIAARARAGQGLRAAMGAELRADMEPHATLVPHDVGDADFAAEEALRAEFDLLCARCRPDIRAAPSPHRMPGVRALLSGPSGTGKTHACAWLATRLGLPLFKLDLSAVVSKYIGETEENLSRILDRAETADCVLLMDEADSLFGARTETKDSSDRFANNQTNYLLSRIEAFDGIVVMTTNGRDRFDEAFARRLDQIIEVPLPAARERRQIWRMCLGAGHGLSAAEINRLAAMVDLPGGHIRNIVRTAEVLALDAGRGLGMADIRTGIAQEFRKIGRSVTGAVAGL